MTAATRSRLATAVRAARARRGWTREQLAAASGLSFAAITQIETGRRTETRVSSLVALADALGVSVDYLVRDETTTPMLDHRAYLGSPSDLEDAVLSAVRRAVDTGHAVLVVTTRPAAGAFRKAVRAHGDVAVESTSEWYTTPPEVMGRFRAFVTTAREDGAEWVHILTEPPREWAGLEPAETRAWLRAESLINMSLAPWPVTLGCLYDAGTVPARVRTSLERTHPEVVATSNGHPRPAYERPEYFLTR